MRFGYDRRRPRHSSDITPRYAPWLNVKPYYGTDANAIATRAAHTASLTMDQPIDIINATIDELIARDVELPGVLNADRLTEQIHARAQSRLFKRVTRRLTDAQKLGARPAASHATCRAGRLPSTESSASCETPIAPASGHADRPDCLARRDRRFFTGRRRHSACKLRSLANQAMALDASALRNDTQPGRSATH
ncbi:DUF4158 domain-containing protein [Burkholderia pseudomallei]